MSRKRLKKAVKKVSSVGVQRVPSAFDDDAFVETDSLKGVFLWPLFNFRETIHLVPRMNSWMLIPFQMLLSKFRRRLFLPLLMSPLSLLMLLPPLSPPLLPKLLLLKPLLLTKPPPNSAKNLSSPFKGGESYRTCSLDRSSENYSRGSGSLSFPGRF
jgi:hypothetical protein